EEPDAYGGCSGKNCAEAARDRAERQSLEWSLEVWLLSSRGMASPMMTRRNLLGTAGLGGLVLLSAPAWAQRMIDLPLPGGPDTRSITTQFPQKGSMILQRTR